MAKTTVWRIPAEEPVHTVTYSLNKFTGKMTVTLDGDEFILSAGFLSLKAARREPFRIMDEEGDDSPSQIVDVAVGSGGIYSLLDKNRGHIFTYDNNGNLLYVFGSYGLRASDLQLPVAMAYSGDTLVEAILNGQKIR